MSHESSVNCNGSHKGPVNLDWTRYSSPTNLTPYQQLIRSIDWGKTGLGSMQSWSRELRQVVLMMMCEIKPVIVYWGDNYTMIYNEAYIPLIGAAHPAQLGMNAPDSFPQFWSFFDGILAEQRQTGRTSTGEASMLLMERSGFMEEAYFNWTLIPIIGDAGEMVGAYGVPQEASFEIIGKRRIKNVSYLSHQMSTVKTIEDFWETVTSGLESNERDLPLALVYSVEYVSSPIQQSGASVRCKLEQSSSVTNRPAYVKDVYDLGSSSSSLDILGQAMHEACHNRQMVVIDATPDIKSGFAGIAWKGFGLPSEQFVVVPVAPDDRTGAVLVLGLNPRLRYNDAYKNYLGLLVDGIAPQLARLRMVEDVKQRAAEAAASKAVLEFQKSEIKFAKFAERSPVGLALTDTEGKVLYANDAWLNFIGLSDVEANMVVSWLDSIHIDDIPLVREWWQKASVQKEIGTFQVRSKVPFESAGMKADYRTAICALYPDLDENGQTTSVMALVLDISEQKWVESQLLLRKQELEESEAKYRTFAERSPHGVVRTDEDGYVQFGNEAWHNFYGFQQGNVKDPQPWVEQLDEDDRVKAYEYFDGVRSSTGTPLTVEVRHKRRTRVPITGDLAFDEIWLMATGWAERRLDGSIDHIIFWVTDITAQKAATRVLQGKMEEAIRLKNQQERFIDMISHEIRNPLSAVLHCGEEIVEAMKRCLTIITTPSGSTQSSQTEDNLQLLIRDSVDNSLDAANTIMYCVQHQKQIVDDVLTLSKLDSDLLVVTPIPVQPVELLRSVMKVFEPQAKASDIQLKLIMDDSVTEMRANWVMLDPNRLLQIVINIVTNAMKFTRDSNTREVTIHVSVRDTPPPQENGHVRYVPQNYGQRPGKRNVDGDNKSMAEELLYICFSVSDTGRGLTETEKLSLFNRFAQASPKTHAEYGGSGLGLFISRQITELLGGEIGVGSGPMGGCTFAFYVESYRINAPERKMSIVPTTIETYSTTLTDPSPKQWVSGTTSAVTAASTERQGSSSEVKSPEPPVATLKRKILVVEDNVINQKVLCKQLRGRGFAVEAANHGQEAIEKLEQLVGDDGGGEKYFDVILCDIEMPVMDGIQCVNEVRRREKSGVLPGHVPIIGVTANVRSKQVNTAIEVGMDGVTTKPYRIDELIAHVDRVCADVKTSTPGFDRV